MSSFRYLGAYHGTYLFERDGQTYKQFNDYGSYEVWREQSILAKEAEKIMARGRDEYDMALVVTSRNIPQGVRPIWETHPRDYLTWHRDNDPPPFSQRAAAALAALENAPDRS